MHFFSSPKNNLEESSETSETSDQLVQSEQSDNDNDNDNDNIENVNVKEKSPEEIIKEMKSGEMTYKREILNGFIFGLFVTLINLIIAIILWLTLSIYWFPILDLILFLQASMFFLMAGILGWFGPSVSLRLIADYFFKTTLDKPHPVTYLMSMLKYCTTASTLLFEAILFGQFYYSIQN